MPGDAEAGPRLVAVHGFGACAAVWSDLRASLSRRFIVHTPDLPGHGGRPMPASFSLKGLARACAEGVSGPAVWLGWSLGGLVALKAAEVFPDKVRAVATVAMGPRFERTADWPRAMETRAVDAFAAELRADPDAALARFYVLQTRTRRGPDGDLARRLKFLASSGGRLSTVTLEATLGLLRGSDLRCAATRLKRPLLTILGSDDALVPAGVAEDLVKIDPDWRVEVIDGAGHAPFLSHPDEFQRRLTGFLATVVRPAVPTS